VKKPKLTPRQQRLSEAEAVLRHELAKKYPRVIEIIDELKTSGLYGTRGTFFDAMVELVAQKCRELIGQQHPLIAKTLAHIKRDVRAHQYRARKKRRR
jgi:hypothetical protein